MFGVMNRTSRSREDLGRIDPARRVCRGPSTVATLGVVDRLAIEQTELFPSKHERL